MHQGQVKEQMVLVFHDIIMKLAIYKYYLNVTYSASLILPLTGVEKTELKICSLIKLSY